MEGGFWREEEEVGEGMKKVCEKWEEWNWSGASENKKDVSFATFFLELDYFKVGKVCKER